MAVTTMVTLFRKIVMVHRVFHWSTVRRAQFRGIATRVCGTCRTISGVIIKFREAAADGVAGKSAAFTGISVVLALGLSAVTLSAQPAPLHLTIGALIGLTGPFSAYGPSLEKAVVLAAQAANQAAKNARVNVTVSLVAADTQGEPQAALSAARTLVDRKASCILGPATTPEAISVLAGITMQRNITLWPQASSTRLRAVKDNGTIYRTVAADDLQSKALVMAIESYVGKSRNVAVIFRNELFGDALSKAFIRDWQAAGGKVVTTVSFDPQQENFDTEAALALAQSPDAYLVIDYPDTYSKLGAALVRTGKFDPKKLFVADALSFAKVPSSIPAEAIEGAHGVAGGSPKGTGAYHLFNKLWDAAGVVEIGSYASNTFDAGILCFLAAVRARSTDPDAIRNNVRGVTEYGAPQFTIENLAEAVKAAAMGDPIDYVGVSGSFHFAPNGDATAGLYDVFEYRAGNQVYLKQLNVSGVQ